MNITWQEEFEDTKGVIGIRISKKNRQHNSQKKKDKQRSTKHTHKSKDRVTRTPLKTEGELRCSRRVSSSSSNSGTRRVNLVTNPVISHEWGKDREVLTTSETYPWSCDRYSITVNQTWWRLKLSKLWTSFLSDLSYKFIQDRGAYKH
jgi:hypothetical protein